MTTKQPHRLYRQARQIREEARLSLSDVQTRHPHITGVKVGSWERSDRHGPVDNFDDYLREVHGMELAIVPRGFDVDAAVAELEELRRFRAMITERLRGTPVVRPPSGTPTGAVIALGHLSLAFGRVDRITFHEDGTTPESDTDHTVMLGLIACALAAGTDLDTGLVAQYALVHDLVEVYAGDTATLRALSDAAKADKNAREHAAYLRIREEFGNTLWWLPDCLAAYEDQLDREARFVRAVDKLLPKITHIANQCATLRAQGIGPVELAARYDLQERELMEYAAEFPIVFDLRAELVGRVMALFRAQVGAVAS